MGPVISRDLAVGLLLLEAFGLDLRRVTDPYLESSIELRTDALCGSSRNG
jgi:hypothetical protein